MVKENVVRKRMSTEVYYKKEKGISILWNNIDFKSRLTKIQTCGALCVCAVLLIIVI